MTNPTHQTTGRPARLATLATFAPRILCFDTETTGIDTANDRIVTAFVGLMDSATGHFIQTRDWLINPGIDISEGAAAVHGISNERAQDEGVQPAEAIAELVGILRHELSRDTPLVIYNAPFDLTLLQHEIARHLGPEKLLNLTHAIILDPLVIDKGVDKYRKGSRKLVDTAAHYGVPVEANAHDAGADCLMTGRVAIRLFGSLSAGHTPEMLHRLSIGWKEEQAESLQTYFRTKAPADKRDPHAVIDGGWPVQTGTPLSAADLPILAAVA